MVGAVPGRPPDRLDQANSGPKKLRVGANSVTLGDELLEPVTAELHVCGGTFAGRHEPKPACPRYRRLKLRLVLDHKPTNVVPAKIHPVGYRDDPVGSPVIVGKRQGVLGFENGDGFAVSFVSSGDTRQRAPSRRAWQGADRFPRASPATRPSPKPTIPIRRGVRSRSAPLQERQRPTAWRARTARPHGDPRRVRPTDTYRRRRRQRQTPSWLRLDSFRSLSTTVAQRSQPGSQRSPTPRKHSWDAKSATAARTAARCPRG